MRILFDLDGVLADLHGAWLELYNKDFDDNLKSSDITAWDIKKFVKPEARTKMFKYINEEGFYTNVRPIQDFIEEAREYVDLGHEVGICTSCNNNATMVSEKLKWTKKHLPFLDRNNIMFVNNKGLARADLLIDDRVKNIEDFLKSNMNSRGHIVRMAHNREDIKSLSGGILSRITLSEKEY